MMRRRFTRARGQTRCRESALWWDQRVSVGVYIRLLNGLVRGCERRGSLRESKEQDVEGRARKIKS